jgi:glycosyltransferase involved in cell wall biosynthesis
MLSVIVPVYDTAAYLRQCMDSLLAQTFDDLEIIVVDDGSTDDSPRIIADYARENAGVVVVRKPNGGLADARNHGIGAARGEYVGFVDSDDYVSPDMYALMCERARATDADVVVCGMTGVDASGHAECAYDEGPASAFGVCLAESPSLIVTCGPSACDKIFRTRLFTERRLSFPVGTAFEDLATTYSLFAHANRIEKVDEPLYFYRRARSGSITGSYDRRYEQLAGALETMYGRFASDGMFDTFREPILEMAFAHLILGRYADFFPYASPSAKTAYIDGAFEHLGRYFPGWRRDPVVRGACTSWWQYAVSTRPGLLKLYAAIPPRPALSLSRRLHMFWTVRA